ncbi:MAG: sensor histidine kinase [Deltaproteobacteria bacterium]|jgi:signal transduction histidine kinase|nr:sensor histidine kinase [Deltaproteobacteria bacterium]
MDHCGILGETGLQFFGKMTASISHEIRNVLAVLNENAGLLEDFILMAEKGAPIDHERLKTLARSMGTQIHRADGIIENMNRFAHGVDERVKSVDLNETIELLVALSGRLADMRGVKLDPVFREEPILITTNPFFLENLLWCFLDFAMGAVGKEKALKIISEIQETGIWIRFSGLEDLAETGSNRFPSELEEALLKSLEADFSVDVKAGEIAIKVPEKIGSAESGI